MKYFFLFCFAFTRLLSDGIGLPINLMYFFEGIQVLSPKITKKSTHNSSLNTYLHFKRKTDHRFINLNRWERGADISEKVILLEPKEEIIFQINTPVDHKLTFSFVGREEPKLFWNENPITT
ncbi:MAG: hypothetical protein N3A69_05620, partial [Leptospiraceae bacterium]|nr:hypothetical protein [Leptospiraceae bacterium]